MPEAENPKPYEINPPVVPDVSVVVEGGVANVDVWTKGIIVEVRDYDVDGCDENDLWEDENGDQCVRYFTIGEGE